MKILLWLLVPLANAALDWYLIEKRKTGVNHVVEVIIRGGVIILYGGAVLNTHADNGVWVILYEITSFYLVFEIALNLMRGRTWDYLGNTSAMDLLFARRRPLFYLVKIGSLVAMLVSIYKIIYG